MHSNGMTSWDATEIGKVRYDSGLDQGSFSNMKRREIILVIFLRYNVSFIPNLSHRLPNLFCPSLLYSSVRRWIAPTASSMISSQVSSIQFQPIGDAGKKMEGWKVFLSPRHTPYFRPQSLRAPAFPFDYNSFHSLYSTFSGLPDSNNIPFSFYPVSPRTLLASYYY